MPLRGPRLIATHISSKVFLFWRGKMHQVRGFGKVRLFKIRQELSGVGTRDFFFEENNFDLSYYETKNVGFSREKY